MGWTDAAVRAEEDWAARPGAGRQFVDVRCNRRDVFGAQARRQDGVTARSPAPEAHRDTSEDGGRIYSNSPLTILERVIQ